MSQRNRTLILLGVIAVLVVFVFAMERVAPPRVALIHDSYATAVHPGARLLLDVSSGGIEVDSSESPELHVEYIDNGYEKGNPEVRVRTANDKVEVRVNGLRGPARMRITVPKNTPMQVSMGAGQLIIMDVSGDKDITLYAGQVVIKGDPAQYGTIESKVLTGRINGRAINVDKGGIARWIARDGPGKSSLSVSLLAGEIAIDN